MKLVELSFEQYICRLAPEIGGAVHSFEYRADNGVVQSLMRGTVAKTGHITEFACWPLVPFSNRINGARFSFGGKDYRLPINSLGDGIHASHGHGCENPWHIIRQDRTSCEMLFELRDIKIWPFPYKSIQNFVLDDKGLTIDLSVTNIGHQPMPTGLGLHPYFPRSENVRFMTRLQWMWESDERLIPNHRVPVPEFCDFTAGKLLDEIRLDNCFEGWDGHAEIIWPDQPLKLKIAATQKLSHLIIYVPPNSDFFCAEPVSHVPNAVNRADNEKTGLVILSPGETLKASCNFCAIPIQRH